MTTSPYAVGAIDLRVPIPASCGWPRRQPEAARQLEHLARSDVEGGVEVDGGVDQRQVGEGLREVADLAPTRVDLLRVQPDVVGVRQHLLEGVLGLFQTSSAGQRVHEEERAQREGSLRTLQAVG